MAKEKRCVRIQNHGAAEGGVYRRGSASIVANRYRANPANPKSHCRQVLIENLGSVVWYDAAKKDGVFLSPTRGLVEYDAAEDVFREVGRGDPRIAGLSEGLPVAEKEFSSAYFLLGLLGKTGLTGPLSDLASALGRRDSAQRIVAHLYCQVMKNGSRETDDVFLRGSALSDVLAGLALPTLRYDHAFFRDMGSEEAKEAFFRSFVALMRGKDPSFGEATYLDSTPLPSDASSPFVRLCCHGAGSSCFQMRLALVLDAKTGYPVWFEVVPGNVVDVSTSAALVENVRGVLGVSVKSMVLDAGYASRSLFDAAAGEGGGAPKVSVLVRMPLKKGFPSEECYRDVHDHGMDGQFVYSGHSYRSSRMEAELFGRRLRLYSYVDEDNALLAFKKGQDDPSFAAAYMAKDAFGKQREKDRGGFFALVSNTDRGGAEKALAAYFERAGIEGYFKDAKSYCGLLPLSKWDDSSVRGKLLLDSIAQIVFAMIRKTLDGNPVSLGDYLGKAENAAGKRGRKRLDAKPMEGETTANVLAALRTVRAARKDGDYTVGTFGKDVAGIFKNFGIPYKNHMTQSELESMIASCTAKNKNN